MVKVFFILPSIFFRKYFAPRCILGALISAIMLIHVSNEAISHSEIIKSQEKIDEDQSIGQNEERRSKISVGGHLPTRRRAWLAVTSVFTI